MPQIFKSRVGLFFITYLLFTLFFSLQKSIFLFYQGNISTNITLSNWFNIIGHGMTMDLSMGAYLMTIPSLIFIISIFHLGYLKQILNIYFFIVSLLIAIVFIPDLELYSYWGFRIDSTVFTYIVSPSEAASSTPLSFTILLIIAIVVCTILQYYIFNRCVVRSFPTSLPISRRAESISLVIIVALMFIPLRGGVTTSTMSPGKAFFSTNMFLNHAAINPLFNMFYSLRLNEDFKKEYRFMASEQAGKVFEDLMNNEQKKSDVRLLKNDRPNIIFIILESFGAKVVEPLGGIKGIAPNLSKLSNEGVFFSNLYANSFRTDRGLVSVLGGFPAQPTMSILSYQKKAQTLKSIPRKLIDAGYDASFLYGGDLDFANMESFVITQKVTDITIDEDFPIADRLTKWGVPDAITFDKLYDDIQNEGHDKPFLKMFLTLSSHEPFDIPSHKFKDPYLNSVAYVDSCLGNFIDKMKASPQWDNTLIVLVPDHDMRFPHNIEYYAPDRHDIFMLWLGGAIKEPRVVDKIGSQVDISKTLLTQLNIETKDFPFSKDLLNPNSKDFAFYTFPNGFGMITDKGKVVFDCTNDKLLLSEGKASDSLLIRGKAYLQKLYDDIDRR